MKKSLNLFEKLGNQVSAITSILTFILTVITLIIGKEIEQPEGILRKIFAFIFENKKIIWTIFILSSFIYLFIYNFRFNRYFTLGFKDNLKSSVDDNWDYIGGWRITENKELVITDSGTGGISNKGAMWENYTFSFDAKIINSCIGVIVRAKDLNNYYMFQINHEEIVPHRRVSSPVFKKSKEDNELELARYRVGWQVMQNLLVEHNMDLRKWFNVKVRLKGQCISIFLNDLLVFRKENFIENPVGKVGFRDYNKEKALVKNIKVTLG